MYILVNIGIIILALIMPGGLLFLIVRTSRRKQKQKQKMKTNRKKIVDIKTLKKMQRVYFADKYRKTREERNNNE